MSRNIASLFSSLNEKQREALFAPSNSVLQIIAGPGTGKTKLLISRVAYLLLHHKIPPSGIIVTTFTKKAANEMKERLTVLMEPFPDVDLKKLQIGTFHSICFGYLKYYGSCIGLKKNTKIADNKDQKDLLIKAIKSLNLDDIKGDKSSLKRVQTFISQHKSYGRHPDDLKVSEIVDPFTNQLFQVFTEYQKLLYSNSMIDFDDILIYMDKLLTLRPECVAHVKHVLVDEYQDTNTIQLNLVFKFSRYCNDNITIVGDADQSIYGFRNATYENFILMEKLAISNNRKFIKITLNQNYRSTEPILKLSEQVMRGQLDRDEKILISNKKLNTPVYYIKHKTPNEEPVFIAEKINSLVKNSEDSFSFKDFAVIVRVSRTFLSLERELMKRGIPYKIVKGYSFWELKEISMTVDLLRIIAFNDWLSFKRVIDWFAVGCGQKLIGKIEQCIYDSSSTEVTPFQIIEEFAEGERPGATSQGKASLTKLLTLLRECRHSLVLDDTKIFFQNVVNKFELIENAFKKKTSTKDDEEVKFDIMENIEELRNQFEEYDPEKNELLRQAQEEIFEEQEKLSSSPVIIKKEVNIQDQISQKKNCLSLFLDHIYLAESISNDEKIESDSSLGKVTLTTIHGAKGLEWPIVLLPSLVNNIIPSRFALNETDNERRKTLIDEERRCFYVALTRAKDQLYLSTYESEDTYSPMTPTTFLNNIPEDYYHDLSEKRPNGFVFNNMKYKRDAPSYNLSYEFKKRKPENSNLPPRAAPPDILKQTPILGSNGMNYNPVTGASVSGNMGLLHKKKKRLGMGRPMKQWLP
ncbi:hypothetical protein CANINC_003107 [Pichia inconspicua]|uniref:DNA 3'-5' helicase n=1 Tax=Pichia inconspicua TaxID=52247 RepID=A0A4T0X0S3_9ASCO|nr:hypothetical protein CANINC_003107 [[Candida] inconspicua]